MKNIFLALGIFGALTLPAAARADTLYTVTNGVLVTSPSLTVVGSYNGTFTLNSYFTIESGNFTATVNGMTYTLLDMTSDNDPTAGYASLADSAGDHLNFQLTNQNNPTLCTLALCFSSDTVFEPATGGYFYANGGTLTSGAVLPSPTPSPSTTPEPSSLVLLGTGVLGLAAGVRRRVRRA